MNDEIEGKIDLEDLERMKFSRLEPKTMFCMEVDLLGRISIFRFDLVEIENYDINFDGDLVKNKFSRKALISGWRWGGNSKKTFFTYVYDTTALKEFILFETKEHAMKHSLLLVMKGHKAPQIYDLPPPHKTIKTISPEEYYKKNPNKRKDKSNVNKVR